MLNLVFLKISAKIVSGKFRVHIYLVFQKIFSAVLLDVAINSIFTTCQLFAEAVLEDTLKKRNINEQINMIKSDNAQLGMEKASLMSCQALGLSILQKCIMSNNWWLENSYTWKTLKRSRWFHRFVRKYLSDCLHCMKYDLNIVSS